MGIGLDPNFWRNNQNPSQLRSVVLTRVPLPSPSRCYPVFRLLRSPCCPSMISPLSTNPSVLWDHVKFFSIVRNPSWLPLPSCLKEVVLSLLYCYNMTLFLRPIILYCNYLSSGRCSFFFKLPQSLICTYLDMSVSIWSRSGGLCPTAFTIQILSVGQLDQMNGEIFNNYFI